MKEKLAIALDTSDCETAMNWARACEGVFGYAKVGLELFFAVGPSVVGSLKELGFQVFLDVKLHDIPNTVYRSAKLLAGFGVDLITVHSDGGIAMLQAALQGVQDSTSGFDTKIVAVTKLTSDKVVDPTDFNSRIDLIIRSGVEGFVSSAYEVSLIKGRKSTLFAIVPGIRLAGDEAFDQERIATPSFALAQGADLLVIGRSITSASNTDKALDALVAELAQ